jgi:L-asparaginase II
MTTDAELIEVWRGDCLESRHRGHVAISGPDGELIDAWGNPDALILPRSSCKMIQALPLIESGAADAIGLTERHLALACASHEGAHRHTDFVLKWLDELGLRENDLICGAQPPRDKEAKFELIRAHKSPGRVHNNCSGKHTGFLTLASHLGANLDYVALDNPVQMGCRAAIEELSGVPVEGYGIDGCSAPNFSTTVHGLARAMAFFATADGRSDARSTAATRLRNAMMEHPDLVAGEGHACTDLMRACGGRAAVKNGADGVYTAILHEQGIGVALKVTDGADRGSNSLIAALLTRLGVLEEAHPVAIKYTTGPIKNWAGDAVGRIQPVAGIMG